MRSILPEEFQHSLRSQTFALWVFITLPLWWLLLPVLLGALFGEAPLQTLQRLPEIYSHAVATQPGFFRQVLVMSVMHVLLIVLFVSYRHARRRRLEQAAAVLTTVEPVTMPITVWREMRNSQQGMVRCLRLQPTEGAHEDFHLMMKPSGRKSLSSFSPFRPTAACACDDCGRR
jgi:hypothetical protein